MLPITNDDLKQAKEEIPNTVDTMESQELTDLQEVLDESGEKKKQPRVLSTSKLKHTVNNDTVIKPWTLIYVSSDEKTNYVKHKGNYCCRKFIGDLNHLTKTADGKDRDVIAFAHNGQRFDLTCIQRALYEDKVEISNQLMNGAKTLSFTYRYEDSQVQFKDSMCFLPMSVDAAGKAFILQVAKGFFPHALQTADSLLYTGEFPSRDKFNPDHMKKDRRDDFLEWHAKEQKRFEEQGLVYDLQKEQDFH